VDADVRVVVVDDQERFLAVARAVVERTAGFRLIGDAADGSAAVERVRELTPDLVLMDINMPVLDGVEAARRIAVEWPQVVVVLLSTYAREDLPAGALDGGARGYLHKEELGPASLRSLWTAHGPR